MDTLSTYLSALKVPNLSSITTPHELHFLKPPPNPTHLSPHSHLSKKTNSVSNRPTSPFTQHTNKSFSSPFHSTPPPPPSPLPILHRKSTTGYAAALLNISQSNNTLDVVERDVRRFLRLIRSVELMEDTMKGGVMKELAEKGRFQRHLVVLVKMLVRKNQVGLVNGVLEEFERIYDELNGTQVVLVSSKNKLKEDQVIGIAKKVQEMNGVMKVRVKNLFHESSPSFAM